MGEKNISIDLEIKKNYFLLKNQILLVLFLFVIFK